MTLLNATQLRTRVTLVFFLTILAIGLIVSAVAFGVLLRSHITWSAEQQKLHLKSKQKALGNCLEHLSEQATQIHSCSLCCNMLDKYSNKLMSIEDLRQDNTQNLARALDQSKMIEGITRTDTRGTVIASVGSVSPRVAWPYIPADAGSGAEHSMDVAFSGIISDRGSLRIIAVSAIATDGKILGYDILFFSPVHFIDALHDYSVKANVLFHPASDIAIVWADGTYSDDSDTNPPEKHARVKQIVHTLEPHGETERVQEWPLTSKGEELEFIYARIPGSEWYLGSYIKGNISFANMLRQHISILAVILGLAFVGGALCYLALRPFTRGFVSLARRLEQTNASLKEEVSERRQIEAELRLSEEQWANTFASIEDAIFILDAEGHISKQNSAARRLCAAYSAANPSSDFLPKERQPSAPFKTMLAQNNSIKQTYEDPSGSTFRITLTPIMINQRIIGAVHLVRDITEETRGEKMKSEMLAAVSHEIRTPVTAITGFVEFMQDNEVPQEQRQEYLQIIHREMDRMSELMNDFLDLQRLQSSMQEYTFAEADVAELVRESTGLYEMVLRKHALNMQVPEHLPPINVDAERMVRAFSNLISNAIKYSPEKGTITIGARSTKHSIFIWVKDEGIGIPPQSQSKIFNRFYRVNDGDQRIAGGLGLGLPLVKEIVGAHRGRVWVESKEGQGSTFFVELPRT
ncbi:MAG: PAS domain-containing sensor histidine kinase [Geobacteraceae bacterium]|nr:PAS domain-containing sensor histidine kinase [Geobacteraceae bacterium]